ncbi:Conserved protein of unknown function; putative Transposase, mutator type [Bradyrhizobium sp. ORS 285]|nr:Conserved hypothetical protein; putative Transposase, mutator type [Bradyrhizobium sp. ORS 285]SMX56330.1 Conserved protein of unknown function; putative Transposase, mutator type [Bradyrhizobium sp. ORS 285]
MRLYPATRAMPVVSVQSMGELLSASVRGGVGLSIGPLPECRLYEAFGLTINFSHPIERENGEIKRRTEVVGIFPNEDAIVRLVRAILLEQNHEWAVQRACYMTL